MALKYSKAIIGNVSLDNSTRIKKKLVSHVGPLISESGIKNEKDAQYIYNNTGIKNFLIGETLLLSNNIKALMKDILTIKI